MSYTDPQEVLVVIPARGGSKGIPFKNLRPVAGRSLVARAVDSALAAPAVTDVVVSTDHPDIAAEAERCGARVVMRPADLSGDTASSESAVLHVLAPQPRPPAVTVLVQCTSPFIDPAHLNDAVLDVLEGRADVAFSVTESHAFHWMHDDGGAVTAVGHSAEVRPRRQDRTPQYRETGAFYAMRTEGFLARKHRFFGRLKLQEVPAEHAVEIDSLEDLAAVRALADQITAPRAGGLDVDALVMDFDGVHTDDHAFVNADGEEFVRVSREDGMGISRLRSTGIPQLILSTERNKVVSARALKLGIDVLQDVADKAGAVRTWMATQRLDPDRVAYVGNDVNDLPAMGVVGWPVAVGDARAEVKAAARTVLQHHGGEGAVREVCELILAARSGADDERGRQEQATAITERVQLMTTEASVSNTVPAGAPAPVAIGDVQVGAGQPVYVIGEIGINHNGDIEIAKQLIDVAAEAGANAVKFQKRTPEISTPADMRDRMRSTPWGEMTYLDYRYRVEFDMPIYQKLISHAADRGLHCFASPWDVPSVAFMEEAGALTHKVASASVTDLDLLTALRGTGKPVILSTGMSTIEQIDKAVETLGTGKLILMHATSTYPLPPEEANLRMITTLQERYQVPVGYSGHERGLQISLAAVALGAVTVERHITLDRTMWGSDQASSLEPKGFEALIRDIRILEDAMGDGVKRVFPGELAPLSRLRRVDG